MLFEELNAPVVQEETPTEEPETSAPSTSETETTTEPEEAPADVSDQPEDVEEEKVPRAQKRIQELTRKNKELEEKAKYWDEISAKVPEAVTEESEDGTVTVDAIADAVLRKQQAVTVEQKREEAQREMQRSAAEALQAYPVLETDDELAEMVVAYAKEKKITFKAAADRLVARTTQAQRKVKETADKAIKTGAASPTGVRVSNGQMAPPNLSNMSEADKAANWDQILASMQ